MSYLRRWVVVATASTFTFSCTLLLAAEGGAVPTVAAKQQRPVRQLDLLEIDVDGNTVLNDSDIQEAMLPFLGLSKTPDDVDKAREALEKLYHTKGFKTVVVTIPRQSVNEGNVILKVIEGRVSHLAVVGSKFHSLKRIKKLMPSLAEGVVPDNNKMAQDLAVLNNQSDQLVTIVPKPSTKLGFMDYDLVVSDSLPLHGLLELNNRYTQGTSELRSAVNISYDNLWQRGHGISLFYQTAPQNTKEAAVIVGSYTIRTAASPLTITLTGMRSNSNVSTLGGIEVIGGGHSYSVRGNWQLPATDKVSRSLSLSIDYKNFASKVNLGGSSLLTPIMYYPISFAYSSFRREDTSSLQLDGSVNVALPHLGSDSTIIDLNRYGARPQMFYSRFSAAYNRDLPRSFQLTTKTTAQISDRPLISNEQLSAGGMDSVRGYLESESIGDYGINASVEVKAPSIPDLLPESVFTKHVQELRPFVFIDGSSLHQHQVLAGSPRQVELLSMGLGFNINVLSKVNAVVDWSVPLVKGPSTDSGDSRLLFRLWTSF